VNDWHLALQVAVVDVAALLRSCRLSPAPVGYTPSELQCLQAVQQHSLKAPVIDRGRSTDHAAATHAIALLTWSRPRSVSS
jgi:hypothetical protein